MRSFAFCLVLVALVCGFSVRAADEFKPGEVWLDTDGKPINAHGGGMLFHDGVYYWYGEYKTGKTWAPECNKSWGGTRVEMLGISCYSSRDLYRWKNEGIALAPVKDDPKHDLHTTKVAERPKVLFNAQTKKFVMWLHIDSEDYKLANAGVAVADAPTGPFKYLGSLRPDNSMSRDMTAFADDDGKAYLFYSSENNATMHISLLTDDYLKPSGRFERVFVGRSLEAPAVVKYKKRYYLMASGCTGWAPNPAHSATADAIFGPWTEGQNPCRGPGAEITFRCQSTFILPVQGKPDALICLLDRWSQFDLTNSRYVWLPMTITEKGFEVPWRDKWTLEELGK